MAISFGLLILIIWSLFWKGLALWKAAGKRQIIWFVIFLVVNTVGILEILYIFHLYRWDIDKGKTLAYLEKKFMFLRKSPALIP